MVSDNMTCLKCSLVTWNTSERMISMVTQTSTVTVRLVSFHLPHSSILNILNILEASTRIRLIRLLKLVVDMVVSMSRYPSEVH